MDSELKRPLSYKKIVPWIVVFLLLSAIPYIVGLLVTPEGKMFVGTFVNPDDLSTYLSAMRQGQQGKWLYHFPLFTRTVAAKIDVNPLFARRQNRAQCQFFALVSPLSHCRPNFHVVYFLVVGARCV